MSDSSQTRVLVSISNAPAYRNLAMFPGSIVERLERDSSIDLYLLVKKGEKFDFSRTAPSATVVEVKEDMHRTLLQRALHFFYSYFIFTDTTKLVSSYGVRSDKPRSIFRYYNFPFKWLIAHTFGKVSFMRNQVAPALFMFANRNHRPYKEALKAVKPDMLFLPNTCIWPADLAVLAEAKRQHQNVLGMPGNWDHLSKYYIPLKPDHLLVWTEAVHEEAINYQYYNAQDLTVVGAPQIDFFSDSKTRHPREEFLRTIGFPTDAKLVLYASQGPYSIDGPDYVDMLITAVAEGKLPDDVYFIVRPHPHGLNEKEKYERFLKNPRVFLDTREGWSSTEQARHFADVLGHADVAVTTFSSVATEASIWDTPTVIANFDGYQRRPLHQSVRRHKNFTHFKNVIATGGVCLVGSPKELIQAVDEYLSDPQKDANGREKLRKEVFGYFDGKSSERMYQAVKKRLHE